MNLEFELRSLIKDVVPETLREELPALLQQSRGPRGTAGAVGAGDDRYLSLADAAAIDKGIAAAVAP